MITALSNMENAFMITIYGERHHKTDRCEMPTASLPAPSLSPHVRLPAWWVLLMASNDIIYLLLLSIRAAILQARSHVLPELREDGASRLRAGAAIKTRVRAGSFRGPSRDRGREAASADRQTPTISSGCRRVRAGR